MAYTCYLQSSSLLSYCVVLFFVVSGTEFCWCFHYKSTSSRIYDSKVGKSDFRLKLALHSLSGGSEISPSSQKKKVKKGLCNENNVLLLLLCLMFSDYFRSSGKKRKKETGKRELIFKTNILQAERKCNPNKIVSLSGMTTLYWTFEENRAGSFRGNLISIEEPYCGKQYHKRGN